jgi:hypothetical protein
MMTFGEEMGFNRCNCNNDGIIIIGDKWMPIFVTETIIDE